MEKARNFIMVLIFTFMSGCATNTNYYGDERLSTKTIGKVGVIIDDEKDNSILRGNVFLKSKLQDEVCGELKKRGVDSVSLTLEEIPTANIAFLVVLQSLGVQTSQEYGETQSGRGYTYHAKSVTIAAHLFKMLPDGQVEQLGIAHSNGDGQNLIERQLFSTIGAKVIGAEKDLGKVYAANCLAATLELLKTE